MPTLALIIIHINVDIKKKKYSSFLFYIQLKLYDIYKRKSYVEFNGLFTVL